MGKYDDIIHLDRPKSNRIPMSRADRAKIFMPFSALKGYEEAIQDKQKILTERVELSDEQREEINRILKTLEEEIFKGVNPTIKVICFQTDTKKSIEVNKKLGRYVEIVGRLRKIDGIHNLLVLEEVTISMEDILEIIYR